MQYPKMRRHEKETSLKQARKIIEKAKYGVLSLCAEDAPYGVPLSHALNGETIYFHCAKQGFKLDIISKNPKGHFVFVSKAKTLPQKATMEYKSAMAQGTLRIVETDEERKKAFKAITDKYMKKYPTEASDTIRKSSVKTELVAMDIEKIIGKSTSGGKKKESEPSINISFPITIGSLKIKNRIVMPPMVRLWRERKKGRLNKEDYKYYNSRAKKGTGLIVVEATAVDKNGQCFKNGLRLWNDKYITQFKKLTEGCHKHGAAVFIQLLHGGYKSNKDLTQPVSASDYDNDGKKARGLTEKEADDIVEKFAQAALRAQKAGFDGVQLHGCHGFLINQFSCPAINNRKDKYAKSSAFGTAIIKRIKELCGDDYIICVRAGIDSPTVKNSVRTALEYQNAGAQMLSISAGISTSPFKAPKEWDYSDISYMARLVKQKASVPIVAVWGITNQKQADGLLKKGYCDMAAVGRNMLIHEDWSKRALDKDKISSCRHCKKGCYFFGTLKKCPAVEKGKKDGLIK